MNGRSSIVASLAGVASVIAASTCCLPVLPFAIAAGLAGSSGFLWAARPYLLAASVVSIAFGFYQARRARQCGRRTLVSSIVLWASAAFVVISVALPPTVLASIFHGADRRLETVDTLPAAFNEAKDRTRVVILLSPT